MHLFIFVCTEKAVMMKASILTLHDLIQGQLSGTVQQTKVPIDANKLTFLCITRQLLFKSIPYVHCQNMDKNHAAVHTHELP